MPRRPRVRATNAALPPKGYYMSHLAPLLAARKHLVSSSAVHLWAVLRAHAWRDGRCDLSDLELSAWMGGLGPRHIFNLRAELVEAGLLATSRTEDGVRWLVPLSSGAREERDSGNVFPEIHFMETEPLKEEEVKFNNIPPPPLPPPPPPGDFTGSELPAAALARFLVEHGAFPGVAGTLSGLLLARMSLDEAEVYSLALLRAAEDSRDARSGRIDAERVTGRWIARLRSGVRPPAWAVAEARDALAAAREGLAEDEQTPADRLAANGRAAGAGAPVGCGPPARGGAPAAAGLAGFPGGEAWAAEPGEPGEQGEGGDGWPEDAEDGVDEADEVGEAEERPWIVSGGRACSHRELWDLALSHLRLQLPASTFDGWLRGTTCTGTDGSGRTLVVQVRDRCAVDWLTVRLRRMVLRTLEGITGLDDLEVRFEEG